MFLLVLGIAMIVYGSAFHSVTVMAKQQADDDQATDQDKEFLLGELAITLDITVGGLTRLDNGMIARTYSGDKPPESACPT